MQDYGEVLAAAEDAEAALNEQLFGISMECFDVATTDEALRLTSRPNRCVRLSTAEKVRSVGWDVLPTFDDPHCTLVLPKPFEQPQWELLGTLFDGPVVNPYSRRR